MSQYIFLQVKEVIKETPDAVTLVFAKPTVVSPLYKSGQFLTLIMNIGGEKIRRSYSLSSSPYTDEDWAITVKQVEGGKMSTYLVQNAAKGDIIETMVPMGIFTYEPVENNTAPIVLIGAGSGITPLCSIIGSTLAKEKNSPVYLIYGSRNEDSIILKTKLEQFKANYPTRFQYVNFLSQPKLQSLENSGRLSKTTITKLLQDFKIIDLAKAHFFVCGPQGMMDEAFSALEGLKVPTINIRKESFYSAPSNEDSNTNVKTSSSEGNVEVNIKYNKQVYKVNVAPGQTILEAALNQDIDLPYSCQSGMCTACMGKCKSGEVEMEDPDGLSANEIKQGFVLTCVGKPLTAGVLIEID